MPQNRKAILQADILCDTFNTEFKYPALHCQNCIIRYHPTCAKMLLYFIVKYAQLNINFQSKQCTEQLVEPHLTGTLHLFRDCYTNSINIENPRDLNNANGPPEERIES